MKAPELCVSSAVLLHTEEKDSKDAMMMVAEWGSHVG